MYDNELGEKSTNKQTDSENIGLLYVSDYLYGASPKNWSKQPYNGTWTLNDNTGKPDKLGNPTVSLNEHEIDTDYRSATDSNWLYMGLWEWFITQRPSYPRVFVADTEGLVGDQSVSTITFVVRPSFYISNETIINGGTGTFENPYTLLVEE